MQVKDLQMTRVLRTALLVLLLSAVGMGKVYAQNNLIVNPDFESGNTSFNSDYQYCPTGGVDAGQYCVDTTSSGHGTGSIGWPTILGYGGSGKYMLVNGFGGTINPTKVAWKQTVTVTPNTDYIFSCQVVNLAQSVFGYSPNPAKLRLKINGSTVGGDYEVAQNNSWHEWTVSWSNGSATQAEIAIYDVYTGDSGLGDDFGLDHLSLTPQATYSVNAVDDDVSFCVAYMQTYQIDVLANDIITPNGQISGATVQIIQAPSHGNASWNNTTRKINYMYLDQGYYGGLDQFKYRVTIPHGEYADAWVYVNTGREPNVGWIDPPGTICAGGPLGIPIPTVEPDQGSGQWERSQTQNGNYAAFDENNVPLSMNGWWVRYTATNDCGQGSSNRVQISVTSYPTIGIILEPDPIYAGNSFNLTIPSIQSNGSTIINQGWQIAAQQDGPYSAFNNNNVPYTYNGYWIRYFAENDCGISYSNSVQITVYQNDNNIVFADANVKAICVANWDTNGDGELSYDEAAVVTDLGYYFHGNSQITSFDELQYFTGLTSIGYYAFSGCSGLTSLIIPNSVASIVSEAFRLCSGLTSLTIPNSVNWIGYGAFEYCSGLTSLTIPNSVTEIGFNAFVFCSGLEQIIVDEDNPSYDSRENCNAIIETSTNTLITGCKNTIIPNSVTWIGANAFSGCTGLTSLTIPNSVTSIGYYAFEYCSGLTSLTIPNSVISIGYDAFEFCSGLGQIIVDEDNPSYDSRENCNAIIETSTNTLITGCKNTIIPNSVTSIGNHAFSGCTGLTSLTIPNSVTSISGSAFEYCRGLSTITVLAETPPTLSSGVFYNLDTSIPVYVPCGFDDAYTSLLWGGFSDFFGLCAGEITITVNPTEGGTVTGTGYYEGGSLCTLTAIPNEGFSFLNWTENGTQVSTNPHYTFTVSGNRNLVANFQTQYTINTSANPAYGGTVMCSKTMFAEDFNNYNVGNHIASAAIAAGHDYWTTWNELPGSSEDGYVENLNGNKCGHLTYGNDQVLLLGNVNHGVYDIKFDIIVPQGKNGFFCILHHFAGSNSIWAMQCYLHLTNDGQTSTSTPGHGTLHAGSYSTADLPCVYDQWMHFRIHIDMDNDIAQLYYNVIGQPENMYAEWQWSLDSFGETVTDCTLDALDFFPPEDNETSEFYFDNIIVSNQTNSFAFGDICNITASPDNGYTFDNWTENGAIVSNDAEYSFTVSEDRDLVANFSSNNAIIFADAYVKNICIANWDTNGDGELSYDEAAMVTDLGEVFKNNTTITSFDELQYFTGLTSISINAFSYCTGLTSIIIPNSVTSINNSAFFRCSSLTSIVIPNAVTLIGNEVFYNCSLISDLEIPNSVTNIGHYAFYGCSGLTSVTIPNSVTSMGPNPFICCSGLEQIIVEPGNSFFDSRDNSNAIIITSSNSLISGCKNTVIPNSVISIDRAFCGCSELTSISIPNSVTTIGFFAFDGCRNLTSITIPASVTSIRNSAFRNCSSLTSISIPNTVTTIGDEAFRGCSGLTEIVMIGTTPPSLGSYYAFSNTNNCPIYVPYESQDAYKTATNWSDYEDRIFPMAYTSIPGYGESEGNYRFIASPLVENTNPTAVDNMITETSYDLYRFDQSEDAEWQNYKANTENFVLENGQGYLYANAEDVNLIFKGEFNEDETMDVELAYDAGKSFTGWNLVGNPFPISAYANRSYFAMNEDGTAVEPNAVSSATAIPACTGVMVKADAAGESVTFDTQTTRAQANQGLLHITLSQVVNQNGVSTGSTTLQDKAIVSFNAADRLEKFIFNKNHSSLSIPQGGKDYAIAYSDKQGELPLNFKATKNGIYTLSVDIEKADVDYLHLIDNLTGADVDLLQMPDYVFTAKTADYASRFRLVFNAIETDGPSTGSGTFAFINNGNIIVTGAEADAMLQIVDVTGRVLVSCKGDAMNRVSTNGMTPGVYVLRLINGNDIKTQKIVID